MIAPPQRGHFPLATISRIRARYDARCAACFFPMVPLQAYGDVHLRNPSPFGPGQSPEGRFGLRCRCFRRLWRLGCFCFCLCLHIFLPARLKPGAACSRVPRGRGIPGHTRNILVYHILPHIIIACHMQKNYLFLTLHPCQTRGCRDFWWDRVRGIRSLVNGT